MPLLVAFIALVIIAATLGGNVFDLALFPGPASIAPVVQKEVQVAPTLPQPVKKVVAPPPTKIQKEILPPAPSIFINTDIKYGPRNGEIIEDTNKVIFEFGATVLPKETEGEIKFETKVEGLEENWQETKQRERIIEFPPGVKEYTFLVRAKINNQIDSSPAKKTFKIKISPYFGKIKISQVRPPSIYGQPSLITLSAQFQKEEEINITGWQVEGKRGSFTIPKGIEQFNPLITTLPFLKGIIVKKGDLIYISSLANPLGPRDWSFRPNKCTGYLTNTRNFPISISKNCPLPNLQRLPRYLTAACKEFIATLGSCQTPKFQKMQDYQVFEDSNCLSYVNFIFNYNGCFALHFQEENFLENQWHIYLDRAEREIMERETDTIYLKDQNGLLVDKYSYGRIRY